jgi:hypothetical protein
LTRLKFGIDLNLRIIINKLWPIRPLLFFGKGYIGCNPGLGLGVFPIPEFMELALLSLLLFGFWTC